MFESCLEKQKQVESLFTHCNTLEEKYKKIIELGQNLTPLDPKDRVEENRVVGCQSITYLKSSKVNGKIHFAAASDALISAGLAALLIEVYHDETAETILKCPPDFLENLDISASLTPNRANGLYSMHLRMKQEALSSLLPPR